jgi:hypothetical protein
MTRDSAEEALHRALAELERAMKASELERAHLERRRRSTPFWPDRRSPHRRGPADVRSSDRGDQE